MFCVCPEQWVDIALPRFQHNHQIMAISRQKEARSRDNVRLFSNNSNGFLPQTNSYRANIKPPLVPRVVLPVSRGFRDRWLASLSRHQGLYRNLPFLKSTKYWCRFIELSAGWHRRGWSGLSSACNSLLWEERGRGSLLGSSLIQFQGHYPHEVTVGDNT